MDALTPSLERIAQRLMALQDMICAGLEAIDGAAHFQEDLWDRPAGGGGRSRVIVNGNVIEKGGVNFSHVYGPMPDRISAALKVPQGLVFHATGVSIVLHAAHPYVPIIHMNVRYFELENGLHWFGGGIDVTPIYVDRLQAAAFHQDLKTLCDAFSPEYYPKFKAWCDDYFFLKHRNETRGIGGLFFDRLTAETSEAKAQLLEFEAAICEQFVRTYAKLVHENASKPFGERELEWQAIRRSRYVEYNLLWDKGTRFGLDTDGRTESILMSMPPMAKWYYNHEPAAGSPEAATLEALKPTEWLGILQDGVPISQMH